MSSINSTRRTGNLNTATAQRRRDDRSGVTIDVVFLHGWLMSPDLWDAQVAALDGIATTHTLTAPAHGTPAPPDGFDMAAWANLVITELDRRDVEQAVIVGHSMSGWLTQQIWRDHPQRVAGIGLVGASERSATPDEQTRFTTTSDRTARDWRALAPTLADLLVGPGFLAANPGWLERWTDHVERDYDLTGMRCLVGAINDRPDYTATTSRINVPTTVIHGTADRVFPPDLGYGHRLANLIPDANLVLLDGVGHAPPIDRPAAVSDALRALVDRVAANTSGIHPDSRHT